jgi:cytochrome P450
LSEAAPIAATEGPSRLRPAAPIPHRRNLTNVQVVFELGKNMIAAFGEPAYRVRYIYNPSWIQHFLLVNDPDGVRHVLLDNVDNYVKGIQLLRITRPVLGNGLVTADGPSWRFQRRVASPMFQMRNVAALAPAMADATAAMLARWAARPDDAPVDASEEMMRLTYDVISRTVFSNDVAASFEPMSAALETYLETQAKVDLLTLLGLPEWVPTPNRLRARGPLRFFRREIATVIAKRRALLARGGDAAPNDLLTLLLTARDPEGGRLFGETEVFDNVMTFIFAGHETTANALTWTLYLLSQFPEWERRIAAEAQDALQGRFAGADDLAKLPLTRMVLEEAMRLYPPVPILSRDTVGPDRVGPHAIGARTSVMISPWLLHRHRELWTEPDYFDPERFAPGRKEKIHRFAYLPFGAGPRICIGMGFAMQEAMIILSGIVQHWRLALEPGHPVESLARITLRPKYGMKMRLHRR